MLSLCKKLSPIIWGVDLLKENSTTGIKYILSKTRNSLLTLADTEGDGVVISIENLSELVTVFRGQSKEEGIQFQIPLGSNEIKYIYLPFAADYLLSTDQSIKISDVYTLPSNALLPDNYDKVICPSPLIRVDAAESPVYIGNSGYKTKGLTNIALKQTLTKEDIVCIQSRGPNVVWKFGELRIRAAHEFTYWIPATNVVGLIPAAAEGFFYVNVAVLQRKYSNPGYVAPEAQLWSLENQTV